MLRPRQPPIQIELRVVIRHVIIGEVRRSIQRDVRRRPLFPLRPSPFAAFQRAHRLFQPAEIHVEADGLDVPRLLTSQQISGAPQLEITQRDAIPRSQISMMLEYLQTFLRLCINQVGNEEIAERAAVAAPHAPPQLVELRQAKAVGPIDDHRVGVRDVEPRFDDHRRHEDVHVTPHESPHHGLEVLFAHLSVRNSQARARRQRLNARGDRLDGLDTIVDEIDLPPTVQLPRDRLLQQRVVPGLDKREHRRPVLGRRLEEREIAEPREREMQRAWDGRRGQRQHVDAELERLQPLLVPHPEAVLLIDDQQAEILERDVGRQQPVRADHDVDLTLRDPLHQGGRVFGAAKP